MQKKKKQHETGMRETGGEKTQRKREARREGKKITLHNGIHAA